MHIEKPILRFDEMLHYFDNKNITYRCEKYDLENYLRHNNYFYKLISYRKNFKKDSTTDSYINLSFEILKDMATLDMYLRYLVLKICLDIEHLLKTIILTEITESSFEDGYSIINKFIATNKDPTKIRNSILMNVKYSPYNKEIYSKYSINPPIWVAFETMSFGIFINFVHFYLEHNDQTKLKHIENLLYSVKHLRNNAAHSSPILNNVTDKTNFDRSHFVSSYISKYIHQTQSRKKLSNLKTYDLTTLLILFEEIVPDGQLKRGRKYEILHFLKRVKKESSLYEKHNQLTSLYEYFIKIFLKKSFDK